MRGTGSPYPTEEVNPTYIRQTAQGLPSPALARAPSKTPRHATQAQKPGINLSPSDLLAPPAAARVKDVPVEFKTNTVLNSPGAPPARPGGAPPAPSCCTPVATRARGVTAPCPGPTPSLATGH